MARARSERPAACAAAAARPYAVCGGGAADPGVGAQLTVRGVGAEADKDDGGWSGGGAAAPERLSSAAR